MPLRRAALLLLVWVTVHPAVGLPAEEPLVLIAHPDVQIEMLPRNTARAIFAMRQRTWPNGRAARVFVLPDAHPVHASFAKEWLMVYPHQLQLSWDRVVFSGIGQAPDRVGSQREMLERVAATPGGIGYLKRGYVDDRVRVVTME